MLHSQLIFLTHRDGKARVAIWSHCNAFVPQCLSNVMWRHNVLSHHVAQCEHNETKCDNNFWPQSAAMLSHPTQPNPECCDVVTASNLLQSCLSSLQHWEIQGWEVEVGQQSPEYIIVMNVILLQTWRAHWPLAFATAAFCNDITILKHVRLRCDFLHIWERCNSFLKHHTPEHQYAWQVHCIYCNADLHTVWQVQCIRVFWAMCSC